MSSYVEIDEQKLKNNCHYLLAECKKNQIEMTAVTKGVCGHKGVIDIMVSAGIQSIADARIENLLAYHRPNIKKILLRMPSYSELEYIIRSVDITLISELKMIQVLNDLAQKNGKKAGIILMVDLGEWREGIREEDLPYYLEEILEMDWITLEGIGVTFTCINGVIPDKENLEKLSSLAKEIENKYNINLHYVSGGNSSSYYLVESGEIPTSINHLRLGETLLLGRETAFGRTLTPMESDVFRLYGEIVEIKKKPTLPIGQVGMDAFGQKPLIEDRGERTKVLLAVGKQDVSIENIRPRDSDVTILGASSDYISLDITDSKYHYGLGDYVTFDLNYGGIMELFTSAYIEKKVI